MRQETKHKKIATLSQKCRRVKGRRTMILSPEVPLHRKEDIYPAVIPGLFLRHFQQHIAYRLHSLLLILSLSLNRTIPSLQKTSRTALSSPRELFSETSTTQQRRLMFEHFSDSPWSSYFHILASPPLLLARQGQKSPYVRLSNQLRSGLER